MAFLAAQLFTSYALLGVFFKALSQPNRHPIGIALLTLALTASALGLALGMFLPVHDSEHGVSLSAINWCVPVFLVSGTLASLIFGAKLFRPIKKSSMWSEIRLGIAVLGAASGIYTVFAATDHLVFMRGDQTGIMNADLVEGAGLPSECEHIILVRLEEGTLAYRCPTLFVLGGQFREWPFAPWPSYISGESVSARIMFDKLMREARTGSSPTNGK